MSGSYWKVGDKVQLGQSDIEISALGSNSFQENQTIGIYIPPSVKFFSGKDCVLTFDVQVAYAPSTTSPQDKTKSSPTKLCFDGTIGANSLFDRVSCYAGNRQTLLEETNEYASWVNVKYSYDTNDALRNKRALTEACGTWMPQTRGNQGTFKSFQNDMVLSPINQQGLQGKNPSTDPDGITTTGLYTKCKVSLELNMGMFSNSTKAFVNMLTNGAYIELTLAPNRKVFRQLDSTSYVRKLGLCPLFSSIDGAGAEWTNSTKTAFYTTPDNSQTDPRHSPFQVGEQIDFFNRKSGLQQTWTGGEGVFITKIIKGTATDPIQYEVSDGNGNGVKPISVMNNATNPGEWLIYSKAVQSDFNPSYTISDCKLIVRQLDMGSQYESGIVSKMKNGGLIQFDLPSVACSLHSVLSGDLQSSIPISIEHAKARSLICMGCDAKPYSLSDAIDTDKTYLISQIEPNNMGSAQGIWEYSDRPYITGIGDNLSSYVFTIDGKTTPSRKIETDKTSSKTAGINQNHLIELEKALMQSHKCRPTSFINYKKNFLIGRALTLDANTIFDGRGRDVRLNCVYEEAVAPQKDKLFKIFCSHVKTISIKGEDIMVAN